MTRPPYQDTEDHGDADPDNGVMQFSDGEVADSIQRLQQLDDTLPFLASDIVPVRGGVQGYFVEIPRKVFRDGIVAMCLPGFPNLDEVEKRSARFKHMMRSVCRITLFESQLRIQNMVDGVAIEVTLPLSLPDKTVPLAGVCFEINYFTLAGLARHSEKQGSEKLLFDPERGLLEINVGGGALRFDVKPVNSVPPSLLSLVPDAIPVPTDARAVHHALSLLMRVSDMKAPLNPGAFILVGEGVAMTVGVSAPACYQSTLLKGLSLRLPQTQWKPFDAAIRRIKGRSRVRASDGRICIDNGVIIVAIKAAPADITDALAPFDLVEKDAPRIRLSNYSLAMATYRATIVQDSRNGPPLRTEISIEPASDKLKLFSAPDCFGRAAWDGLTVFGDLPDVALKATVSNDMLINASCVNYDTMIELKFCPRCLMFVEDRNADYRFRYLMPHMKGYSPKERGVVERAVADGPKAALLQDA